jgi:hypothetical protein
MKFSITFCTCLSLLFASLFSSAASLEDLRPMLNSLENSASSYGAEQVADLISSSSSPAEKAQLIRIQAIFSLLKNRNEAGVLQNNLSNTYPSQNFSFLGKLMDLSVEDLKEQLALEIHLLASTLLADEEKAEGFTPHTLDTKIFTAAGNTASPKTPAKEASTPTTQNNATPKTDSAPVDPLYTKIKAAIADLKNNENGNIMILGKASFETDKPILQGALVRVALLGFIKNKYSKTSTFVSNVNKKLNPSFTSFIKSDAFYTLCASCNGGGDHVRDCRDCDEGKCPNPKCRNGQLVYKGLNNKMVKKPCPVCKGTKNCTKCAGAGSTAIRCTKCSGKGRKHTNEQVPDMFVEAVLQLDSIIDQFIATGDAIDEISLREQQAAEAKLQAIENKRRDEAEKKRQAALDKLKRQEEAEKRQAEQDAEATDMITLSEEDITNKGRTPGYLTHIVGEFVNQLQVQQRRTGFKMASKVLARPPEEENNNKTTIYMTASEELIGTEKGVRNQMIDGLYRFWILRCQSNGVASEEGAQFIVRKPDGTTLSTSVGGKTTYK